MTKTTTRRAPRRPPPAILDADFEVITATPQRGTTHIVMPPPLALLAWRGDIMFLGIAILSGIALIWSMLAVLLDILAYGSLTALALYGFHRCMKAADDLAK